MTRKYLNNYSTRLTAPLTDTGTVITVGTPPPALAPGDYCRLQLARYEVVNGRVTLVRSEFVDVTDVVGNDLTVRRYDAGNPVWGADVSTPQAWIVGDLVQLAETAQTFADIPDVSSLLPTSGGVLLDAELKNYHETEYTIPPAAGAVTVNRTKGGIQHFAPTGDVTLTWSLPAGAKQQLYVTPNTHLITWGGDHWMTDVIDTTGKTRVHVVAENAGGEILLWDGGSH